MLSVVMSFSDVTAAINSRRLDNSRLKTTLGRTESLGHVCLLIHQNNSATGLHLTQYGTLTTLRQ